MQTLNNCSSYSSSSLLQEPKPRIIMNTGLTKAASQPTVHVQSSTAGCSAEAKQLAVINNSVRICCQTATMVLLLVQVYFLSVYVPRDINSACLHVEVI